MIPKLIPIGLQKHLRCLKAPLPLPESGREAAHLWERSWGTGVSWKCRFPINAQAGLRIEVECLSVLVEEEITDEIRSAHEEQAKADTLNAKKRRLAQAKQVRNCGARADLLKDLQGSAAYIETGVLPFGIAEMLGNNGMHEVIDKLSAALFIVSDVGKPGQRVNWASALVGGCIADVSLFKGGPSPIVAKEKAINIYKEIWISDTVGSNHATLAEMIRKATTMRGSQWKVGVFIGDAMTRVTHPGNPRPV